MADKVRPAYPVLYDAIKAKLWEARREWHGREDEPGVATMLGATEFAELVLNWHMPAHTSRGVMKDPACEMCTGEYIIRWPCDYTLKIAGHVGIEIDRGDGW